MRRLALLLALALVSCGDSPVDTAPATSAPAGTPTLTPAISATPTPTAAVGEIRIPLESGQAPLTADNEVLIVVRRLIDGHTTRVEAVELKGGALHTVHEATDVIAIAATVRDGVVTLVDMEDAGAGPQDFRFRVYAGRWRDPGSIVLLDDVVLNIPGGDGWNPVPNAQTNGFEVAWLHAAQDQSTYELRVREADGTVHAVYASKDPFTFALARSGDIAIGGLLSAATTGNVALQLYSAGTTKTLATRASTDEGLVVWQGRQIIWSKGLGTVARITGIERIDPGTLSRDPVAFPSGCTAWIGGTDAQLGFLCDDHLELAGPGPARAGPPIPLLRARAIIRTEQGPPPLAFVTPVVTDDPRAGTGARF